MRNLILQFTGAAAAALLAFCPAVVRAQGVTSSAIEGTITDASGRPVVGATVTGVHTPSGTTYNTVSRDGGRYNFNNVRVGGPYSVTVTASGSTSKRITGINTELSQAARVDIKLTAPVASSEAAPANAGDPGRVVVEASAVDDETFSPNRTGASTTVVRTQIDALPSISGSLQDFTRLTPQVSGGSVSGQNNRFNNITVDGATINDAFGLSASGVLTDRAEPVSLEAVETFRVNISPYDVKFSNFTGGSIDAVTRSGTNKFSGAIYGRYRDGGGIGRLRNSAGQLGPSLSDFEEYTYGFRFGGPLIKDKLFFFVSYETKRRTEPQLGTIGGATTFFPATQAVFDDVIGFTSRPLDLRAGGTGTNSVLGTYNPSTPGIFLQDLAARGYGYNPGNNGVSLDKVNDDKLIAKVDWNITKDQKFSFTYKRTDALYTDGLTRNNNAFALTGLQFERPYLLNSYVAQLFSTWTPKLTTEARIGYNTLRTQRTVSTPFPAVSVSATNNNSNFINFGVERSSQQNALDQDILESVFNASYYAGNHTLTAGVNVDRFAFKNLFIQDAFGTYQFASLDDYFNGRPNRYRYSYSLLPGGATPIAEFTYYNLGLYLQDEWKPLPNLTIVAGIRADLPIYESTPLNNTRFTSDYNILRPGSDLRTDRLPENQWSFSPRIGFNWNVFGTDFSGQSSDPGVIDPKSGARLGGRDIPWWKRGTVVRGGVGIFNGVVPRVFLSNQFSNTGLDIARIDQSFGGAGQPALQDNFFQPNPTRQPQAGQSGLNPVQTTAIALTDRNFSFPQVIRSNFAIDQALPFGLVLTLEGIVTKNLDAVVFQNLNLAPVVGTNLDGRLRYSAAALAADDPRRRYTSVILMSNVDKGYSYSATAQLERRRGKDGFYFKTAYTYGRAYSVNDATSSVALSNYEFRQVGVNGPNANDVSRSAFETRHRVIAQLDYQFALRKGWETTIGLFYEGKSGIPYSYGYTNDANGDGQFSNDLVYVPRGPNDPLVAFGRIQGGVYQSTAAGTTLSAAQQSAAFFDLVNRNRFLRENQGKILPRFGGTNPWIHRVDLRITQAIPMPLKGKLEAYFDVLNLLNLLDRKSGLITTWGGNTFGTPGLVSYAGQALVNGQQRMIYTYTPGVGERSTPNGAQNIESRWQIQTGLKYSF